MSHILMIMLFFYHIYQPNGVLSSGVPIIFIVSPSTWYAITFKFPLCSRLFIGSLPCSLSVYVFSRAFIIICSFLHAHNHIKTVNTVGTDCVVFCCCKKSNVRAAKKKYNATKYHLRKLCNDNDDALWQQCMLHCKFIHIVTCACSY